MTHGRLSHLFQSAALLPVVAVSFLSVPFAKPAAEHYAVVDEEAAQVHRSLSNAPTWSRPAPRIWSSRPDVRWSARWQSAPKYAV